MSESLVTEEQPTTETSPATQTPQAATAIKSEVEDNGGGLLDFDLLRRQMAHCGEYTFQALAKLGKLTEEDTGRISAQYLKSLSQAPKGKPLRDALDFLVFEAMGQSDIDGRPILLQLTRSLLRYSKTKVSHITFAHQNENPIEFYTSFPKIAEISRLLGSPIIQVSEKDFFTVTGINPFTATAAARLIANEIEEEFARKPIYFVTTTEISSWKYICERHFGT